MTEIENSRLSAMEQQLKERFDKGEASKRRLPSTIENAKGSPRINQLVLPDDMRPKMPFTKDKYIIRENPHLVEWERETRKFLRNLSTAAGHRVAAVMIYEWATGIRMTDIVAEERRTNPDPRTHHTTWRGDLIKINKCLAFYFGKPYMTYIMGRKIPKAYTVPIGYFITRHRPMTLTLYAEFCEGTLDQ